MSDMARAAASAVHGRNGRNRGKLRSRGRVNSGAAADIIATGNINVECGIERAFV
jgi:hypothetical protein